MDPHQLASCKVQSRRESIGCEVLPVPTRCRNMFMFVSRVSAVCQLMCIPSRRPRALWHSRRGVRGGPMASSGRILPHHPPSTSAPGLNLRRTFTLNDLQARVPPRHVSPPPNHPSPSPNSHPSRVPVPPANVLEQLPKLAFWCVPRAERQVVEHTPACGLPDLKPAHAATFDDGSYTETQWIHLVWYDGAQGHGSGETCRKTQCDRVRFAAARRGPSCIRLRGPYENPKEAQKGQSWYALQALCPQ